MPGGSPSPSSPRPARLIDLDWKIQDFVKLIRAVLPIMEAAGRGSILNVSSEAGLRGMVPMEEVPKEVGGSPREPQSERNR